MLHGSTNLKPFNPYLLNDAYCRDAQDDAAQVLLLLLPQTKGQCVSTPLAVYMLQTLRCAEPSCGRERRSEGEYFSALLLPFRDSKGHLATSVQEAVDAYMPREFVELSHYACAGCRGICFWKTDAVRLSPHVLQMSWNRWATHRQRDTWLHSVEANPALNFKCQVYNLRPTVMHLVESANSGHYICVARQDTSNDVWLGVRRRTACRSSKV